MCGPLENKQKSGRERAKETEMEEKQATAGCCSSYDIAAVIVCSEPQAVLQKYNSLCVCI